MILRHKHPLAMLLWLSGIIVFSAIGAWSQQPPDWPMHQFNLQRQSANDDTGEAITPESAAGVGIVWQSPTGGVIATSPIVVNGAVYIGAWDGWFYALNAENGLALWKTFLGVTPSLSNCRPSRMGINSAAAVNKFDDGRVYVYLGGMDNEIGAEDRTTPRSTFVFALDAFTGEIVWRRAVGMIGNLEGQGYYPYSSPAIANGQLYFGMASFGLCPPVVGQVYSLDLETGMDIVPPHNLVNAAAGETGAGVWGSPAVDDETGTLYVPTGNPMQLDYRKSPEANSIVALDGSTLETKAQWQLPAPFGKEPGPTYHDLDFGAAAIIFPSGSTDPAVPRKLVGAVSKNGVFYALDADDPLNLRKGPIWTVRVAEMGSGPQRGEGSISSPAFVNGTLYLTGGYRDLYFDGQRTRYEGSVVAVDPANGRIRWRHRLIGPVLGSTSATSTGVIMVSGGKYFRDPDANNELKLIDGRDGATLQTFGLESGLCGPSGFAVSGGMIYTGSHNRNMYGLGLIRIATNLPQYAPPSGLNATPGNNQVSLTWVSKGGAATFNVERTTTPNNSSSWMTVATGLTAPTFNDKQVANGNIYYYRVKGILADGAVTNASNEQAVIPTGGVAGWLSKDVNTELAGSADVAAGVWTVNGSGRDIFDKYDSFHYVYKPFGNDDVEISARLTSQTPTSPFTKSGLDIRSATGTQGVDGGGAHLAIFWLPGNKVEINYRSDLYSETAFVAGPPMPLPVWLRVRKVGQYMMAYWSGNGRDWSQLGPKLDFRDRLQAGVLAGLAVTAHDDAKITQAKFDNVSLTDLNLLPPPAPLVVRGVPGHNEIVLDWDPSPRATGYHVWRASSSYGSYTRLTASPIPQPTYRDSGVPRHVPFFYKIVALNQYGENMSSEFRFRSAPTDMDGWRSVDINTKAAGDMDVDAAIPARRMTIWSEGVELWGAGDSFRYTYKTLSGNGEISAKVASFDSSDPSAKAGVMMREARLDDSLSGHANSKHFSALWTGSNCIRVQHRSLYGQGTVDVGGVCGSDALSTRYLRIVRNGDAFTAYRSGDGFGWQPVGPTVNISMRPNVLRGVAVASHALDGPTTAQFEWLYVQP
ncbi:MAG: PQQ-binding-like beta-propeller repeat protein [Acidobacteria bacterium]|nr:PQQ-binding-like beta-propeller repeat protein [Acidobacteriota bacterium]